MREYELLGHMQPAQNSEPFNQCVYIPHHSVFREDSATTHLRVVFNASSATSNGSSLNDHLLAGPKLQTDLPTIILQWRHFKFVYTADIAKMYRQILVDQRDIDYQRIIWKDDSDEPIKYQLLTVTYGMKCALFLALRVLKCLIDDEGIGFHQLFRFCAIKFTWTMYCSAEMIRLLCANLEINSSRFCNMEGSNCVNGQATPRLYSPIFIRRIMA